MSKREKIIVSLMVATVLLGGYLYSLPGTTDNQRAVEMQLDASTTEFVHKVIQKFKQDTTLAVELFAIRSAERKWEKDPFLDSHAQLSDTPRRRVFEKTPATDDARLNLVYAGYVEVGSQRLAIINGMEYTTGETIDDQGYYVRRIQPHRVEIGKRNAPDVILLKLTAFEAGMGK
jgi:hypothetical protein